MRHWAELRTALVLARCGTVSGAAKVLGVHRATINRHIDLLEASFGEALFRRHPRGYSLTETGEQMLEVAARAEEMFTDLAGRSRARAGKISGQLVVTSLSIVAPLIVPAMRAFHLAHPEIELEFEAGAHLARLDHGEAHIAFRAGAEPDTPDYVALPYGVIRFGLYCSRDYAERRGTPHADGLEAHEFVGTRSPSSPVPYAEWMRRNVAAAQLALATADHEIERMAVRAGIGLGFLPEYCAEGDAELLSVLPPSEEWSAPIWIVTHMDLHRTDKVQAFLKQVRALNILSP